ncbi:hypothetical protein LMA04_00625 [Pseudescherichia vulneris]|uniref:hypothetical protein n=1 Tax=Pseudescherichia vulneris TaxID=566 RepID=UPI00227CB235|nr:hypothetical protein [Pseudescherichia vulneris]WAH52599.1 hypothetical protein LMA04_00625 [Pseudescherichia vulneris]
MSMELIITIGAALVGVIAAAFGFGHSKGKTTAEQKATERETEIKLEAESAVRQRQATVSKEASDVKSDVNRMSDSDVERELLRDWTRKDSGN